MVGNDGSTMNIRYFDFLVRHTQAEQQYYMDSKTCLVVKFLYNNTCCIASAR